jgi:hypothetical protein
MLLPMNLRAAAVMALMLAVVVVGVQAGEQANPDTSSEAHQQSDNAVDSLKVRQRIYAVPSVQCPVGAICDDPDRWDGRQFRMHPFVIYIQYVTPPHTLWCIPLQEAVTAWECRGR